MTRYHFRNGYDKYNDITEDEYLDQLADLYWDEDRPAPADVVTPTEAVEIEGEPYEDTYLPGIADYDIFGRPSWEVNE